MTLADRCYVLQRDSLVRDLSLGNRLGTPPSRRNNRGAPKPKPNTPTGTKPPWPDRRPSARQHRGILTRRPLHRGISARPVMPSPCRRTRPAVRRRAEMDQPGRPHDHRRAGKPKSYPLKNGRTSSININTKIATSNHSPRRPDASSFSAVYVSRIVASFRSTEALVARTRNTSNAAV